MTFGEKRRALRLLRASVDALRQHQMNLFRLGGSQAAKSATLHLPDDVFDAVQWALSCVKTWVPELDDQGDEIRGKGHWTRLNSLYTDPQDNREHFMLKGSKVYRM